MKSIGFIISVVVHIIVLGWGLVAFTLPVNFEPEEIVYIPIELAEFADTASARKGDDAAPLAEKPAPKPIERITENEEAENVGEGKLDTEQPYMPKEKDRQVERSVPMSGKPNADKPVVTPEPPQEKQQEAPRMEKQAVAPKPPEPEPQPESEPEPETEPETKTELQPVQEKPQQQEAIIPDTMPKLPAVNAPIPAVKPQPKPRVATRGEESVEDILAKETAVINKQKTQGGASKGSTAQAAMGGSKNVGDDRLQQTVRTLIGGCINRQFNIGALSGRHTDGLIANIKVNLNQDGTFSSEPQITPSGGDQDSRDIFARQAYTAVFTCQLVFKQLPLDRYNEWRALNLNVRPPLY